MFLNTNQKNNLHQAAVDGLHLTPLQDSIEFCINFVANNVLGLGWVRPDVNIPFDEILVSALWNIVQRVLHCHKEE